ncbi:MAG: amidohydrolase family protein, partial [Pseudoflavonifractor sp.]
TLIDAGTAGWANYDAFHNTVIANSLCRVHSAVGYNSSGQVELGYLEDYNRTQIRPDRIRRLLEKYPGEVVGIKMRFQKEVVGEDGLHYLEELITVAEEVGCPVVVHTTNPPVHGGAIASLLRKGDIYCHCYQGKGLTILDENGAVRPEVLAARKRGVLFDAANGTSNFSFAVARAAMQDGFYPDLIGADNAINSFGLALYATNLPFVLSKYLSLGMGLMDVLACATSAPAKFLGRTDIGTLHPGALADLAIFSMSNRETSFWDSVKTAETEVIGHEMLVPRMTWLGGQVVFRSNDF